MLHSSPILPGKAHTFPPFHAARSDIAPLRKFRWTDCAVSPCMTIHYRVHLAYGTADAVQLGESLELTISSCDGHRSNQSVIFNRAVAASQAFQREILDLDAQISADKNLPIEAWRDT